MNEYPDDAECPICHKNINKILSGEIECRPCDSRGLVRVANLSVLGHIWEGLVHIFNFEFICALANFKWAQERACKTGDFDRKTGRFYIEGYIKE